MTSHIAAALATSFVLIEMLCGGMPAHAQPDFPPFAEGILYDTTVQSPSRFLGFPLGSRPARYQEMVRYGEYLARTSPRVKLQRIGQSYEGRSLYALIITSEENHRRMTTIRENLGALADDRSLGNDVLAGLIDASPAVAWIGYSIHGDELSGVDAGLQVAYHLAAGIDNATCLLVRELVVLIDPIQNPDGRERFLAQMQQWAGPVPISDAQSIHHTGVWPFGRGNHYFFDLNRDWFLQVHPETRARVAFYLDWLPQLAIDVHEMNAYDTYLFSPPREPINPNVPTKAHQWWKTFATDQARAFDRFGWSYYTREWNDEWYPGYGGSYGLYTGGISILYEQAGVEGSLVKQPDGATLTYRETVQHHVVSSLANLTTAATNKRALLENFHLQRKARVGTSGGQPSTFFLLPGKNPARVQRLVENLLRQNIKVWRATREIRVRDLHGYADVKPPTNMLPAGTYVVSLSQPNGRLAKTLLEPDPRMTSAFLQEERKSLEKEKDSKLYDVTAWSLPLAYGVEAYWTPTEIDAGSLAPATLLATAGAVEGPSDGYGFLLDCTDDRAVDALALLLDGGYKVRMAREPFEIGGRSYPRGSALVRRNENPLSLVDSLTGIARRTGATLHGVQSALSVNGPDLGGNDMVLLEQPRVLLLGGFGTSVTSFGALWHLLDQRLGIRASLQQLEHLAMADLQKYNIVLLPSGEPRVYARLLGKEGAATLRQWIEAGGTLIAVGEASAFVADTATGLSAVRLRQHVLKDLDLYARALELEENAGQLRVDSAALWGARSSREDTVHPSSAAMKDEKTLLAVDERGRLFMPHGCIMNVDLDEDHWLSYGAGGMVPALVNTSNAFLAKDPVRVPARFSSPERLRLSGLLWPEARERWARSAYATREAKGRGQIILFAGEPNFRGSFHGTERLLLNSLLLGPGFGAVQTVPW